MLAGMGLWQKRSGRVPAPPGTAGRRGGWRGWRGAGLATVALLVTPLPGDAATNPADAASVRWASIMEGHLVRQAELAELTVELSADPAVRGVAEASAIELREAQAELAAWLGHRHGLVDPAESEARVGRLRWSCSLSPVPTDDDALLRQAEPDRLGHEFAEVQLGRAVEGRRLAADPPPSMAGWARRVQEVERTVLHALVPLLPPTDQGLAAAA